MVLLSATFAWRPNGVFGSALDLPGPKKGQKGPFGATHGKTKILVILPLASMARQHSFSQWPSAVSGPPKRARIAVFASKTRLRSAGASLLLGEVPKVSFPFRPPGARKTAETARFGRAAGKIELTAASAPKFRSSDPLESSGLMEKRPRYGPFLPKISFHLPTKPC